MMRRVQLPGVDDTDQEIPAAFVRLEAFGE
jgi:hypothetical protein